MKRQLLSFVLCSMAFAILACGGNDNPDIYTPNPGGQVPNTSHQQNNGNATSAKNNQNQNAAPIGTPIEVTRLEFPKLHGNGCSIYVYRVADPANLSLQAMNYALEWDHAKRAQRWSCWMSTAQTRTKGWNRANWKADNKWRGDPFQWAPGIPNDEQPRVTNEFSQSLFPDGSGRGYDRGHICASEDRIYSKEANEQTFYMANMQPQVHNFNAGIWMKMENCLRSHLQPNDTLYICKGGTIDQANQILSYTRSNFIVPKYFFMAVLLKNASGYHAFGFYVEHRNLTMKQMKERGISTRLTDYMVNIAELQRLTGIDFFCNLTDDIENEVENKALQAVKFDFKDWGINQ